MTGDAQAKRLRRINLDVRLGEAAVRTAAEVHAEAVGTLANASARYAAVDQAYADAAHRLKETRAALNGRVSKSGSTPGLDLSALEKLQAGWLAAREACTTLAQRRSVAERALKDAEAHCDQCRKALETQSHRLKRIRERAHGSH